MINEALFSRTSGLPLAESSNDDALSVFIGAIVRGFFTYLVHLIFQNISMRYPVILLFVTGLIASGSAQTLRLQTGMAISELDWRLGDYVDLFDKVLIGPSVFIGITFLEKASFDVSANVGYLQKGGRSVRQLRDTDNLPVGEVEEKYTFEYLSMNVMADFHFMPNALVKPFISAGPRFDYLLGFSDDYEIEERIRHYNFGLLAGIGAKYPLNRLVLGLRADYYINFNKLAEWPPSDFNVGGSISESTLTVHFTVGYRIREQAE